MNYFENDNSFLWQTNKLEDKRREGIKEGRREGKLEGIKERNYSIAKTLKQMNMDNASISKATGLTIEEIEKL